MLFLHSELHVMCGSSPRMYGALLCAPSSVYDLAVFSKETTDKLWVISYCMYLLKFIRGHPAVDIVLVEYPGPAASPNFIIESAVVLR